MSVLEDLGIPMPKLVFVSQDLYREYNYRKKQIDLLKKAGTHPADTRASLQALARWCVEKRAAGMGGSWPIVLPQA